MSEMQKWIDRQFPERPDAGLFPMIVERLRGAPARVEEAISLTPPTALATRLHDTWSVLENVGHLIDLESLWEKRLDEFIAGAKVLAAADMSNRRTHEAGHNTANAETLAAEFRRVRATIVAQLDVLPPELIERTALHPRLQQPMRTIDLCLFVAEHDDHHLARMTQIRRRLAAN